ncbi:conserved unknown protein [Ectocarpus siliculosus]|uniref:Methyltransferase domain-containing protein n=1 Tax=Ectocarpus siliculosus TaxID=2880 RepID=D7FIY8_ECTSI|nr:conserved unknown protein [Ectocarpus siliculosus]|eukprot:CBJ49027.1 conserved unknown protein [Ectocarpus siliculosus]
MQIATSMTTGGRSIPWVAVLASLSVLSSVTGFQTAVRPTARNAGGRSNRANPTSSPDGSSSTGLAAASTDFGGMLGDKVASAIVGSPIYPLLVRQAKGTMKKSAEDIGVDWDAEVARLRDAQDWDAALAGLLETSSVEVPDYYKKPFHAYADGNLCWEAAWEQHLASKAVGFRNFPEDAERGEYLLRKGYEAQMERLGVLVEDGGLVVDLGCGSGTSTRYLAEQFPSAGKVVGVDLSPYMLLTGRFMQQEDENADPRVELEYGDAARTGLEDNSASLVSLSLVVHELSTEGRRSILAEAFRILRPGGSVSIMEMDPSAPGYIKLRNNPMLFSILRSTEPYLDVYFSEAGNIDAELQEAGFTTVRKSGVTGRHMAVVGVKGGTFDLRADFKQREKDDTHLQTHRADVWVKTR